MRKPNMLVERIGNKKRAGEIKDRDGRKQRERERKRERERERQRDRERERQRDRETERQRRLIRK